MASKKAQAPQTAKGKIEKKLINLGSQEIVDAINGADEDECKAKLAKLSSYENETEKAQKEDEDIVRLTEELKEAKAPYKETLTGIKLQRNLIGFRLEELGKGGDGNDGA